jgi:hypothetical protein
MRLDRLDPRFKTFQEAVLRAHAADPDNTELRERPSGRRAEARFLVLEAQAEQARLGLKALRREHETRALRAATLATEGGTS